MTINLREYADENELQNLMFKSVHVFKKDSDEKKYLKNEVSARFIISKLSNFNSLKTQACSYWVKEIFLIKKIENEAEFILTDINEAVIYDGLMKIDTYMRNYSVMTESLLLVSTSVLISRLRLLPLQNSIMRQGNLGKIKQDKRKVFPI